MHRQTGAAKGIMVWGGIGYHSRTPIVRIVGTLNSQRYISEVLDPVVLHYLQPNEFLLAASVKLTYSASMVDRLTDLCLKVRHEIGVSSIKVMNPPIDTRSSLFVAKSESE
ncbi:hypothetical protein TNCV_3432841 [Trichonephila clavipes]|nr:hypothetical protein TNCV_3432841 [Trichonephila clavipes]